MKIKKILKDILNFLQSSFGMKIRKRFSIFFLLLIIIICYLIYLFIVNLLSPGNYIFVEKWGSEGSGDGQFKWPGSIAVDKMGNVYVGDCLNYRIQKFDSNGKFLTKWGSEGSDDEQFKDVGKIAVEQEENVYVLDSGVHLRNNMVIKSTNQCIKKFDSNGKFLIKWGAGNFAGITTNQRGRVFVTHPQYYIVIYSSEGKILANWDIKKYNECDMYHLSQVGAIAVDSWGYMYVTYGTLIRKLGSFSINIMEWDKIGFTGITVDSKGYIFATNGNNSIYKFNSWGKIITKWGTKGSGDGQFNKPSDVAVDSEGNVYVADSGQQSYPEI